MEPKPRKDALNQGAVGVLAALSCLILLGWFLNYFPPRQNRMQLLVVRLILVSGIVMALLGVWRLGIARDRRWDAAGLAATGLMLLAGYPILFLMLYLLLTSFLGTVFGGT